MRPARVTARISEPLEIALQLVCRRDVAREILDLIN